MNEVYGLQNQRLKPKLNVLRGWNPDTSSEFRTSLPVALGVTIMSGQLVQPKWNATAETYEWVLGGTAGAEAQYFWADEDSAEGDVLESGKLPALSCSGQFVLETAYFTPDAPNVYNRGKFVTVDAAVPGNVKMATAATLGDQALLAECEEVGAYSVKGKNSNVQPYVLDEGELVDNPGLLVVKLRTAYTPAHAHA